MFPSYHNKKHFAFTMGEISGLYWLLSTITKSRRKAGGGLRDSLMCMSVAFQSEKVSQYHEMASTFTGHIILQFVGDVSTSYVDRIRAKQQHSMYLLYCFPVSHKAEKYGGNRLHQLLITLLTTLI